MSATVRALAWWRRGTGTSAVASSLPYVVHVAGLAGLYYALAEIGLSDGALTGNVTPVWPPTGLALAALVLFGYQLWPGVFLGALLVNGLSAVPLGSALGMATGNTLEAVVGAYLLVTVAHFRPSLDRVRDVIALAGLSALVATVVSATAGVVSLRLGGVIPGSAFWSTWRVWWIGDALGALVVAPAVMVWVHGTKRDGSARDGVEGAVLAVVVIGSATIAFSGHFNHPYLVFPGLMWAALRFRQWGATTATLAVSSIAVVGTIAGYGPFARGSTTTSLWTLDLFLAVVALTGLVLGALVNERDRAADEQRDAARRLEVALRELDLRAQELDRSNHDLEQFAYVASHDLKEPLRAVRGFSQLLARDYEGRLDTQADEYLDFINDGAGRMQSLVDALLSYSRVGTETAPRTFPLRAAVDDALANLRSIITPDARIDIDELPNVTADPGQLTQVLQNLVANALKFRSDAPPVVRVSAAAEGGRWVISVSDNGIGIDPQFRRQIFHMFQRLHARDEYEGTGVGLAICKKLVEGWGGWIWVESEPGAGATFRFTIRGEAP
jgi:signal transduction histidine kinase